MIYTISITIIILLSLAGYFIGRFTSRKSVSGEIRNLHSLPGYYGLYVALWCGIPALIIFNLWLVFEPSIVTFLVASDLPQEFQELSKDRMTLVLNEIKNIAAGFTTDKKIDEAMLVAAAHYNRLKSIGNAAIVAAILAVCIAGLSIGTRFIRPEMKARVKVEHTIKILMLLCSTVAIFTTLGIVLSVLFEAVRFFKIIPLTDFLFGLEWSPQMAIRADQVGAEGAFGVIPIVTGTVMISSIAMLVAVPIGLMSAVYMSEYASSAARTVLKPLLEILAGIPTVVYGFFAALVVAPFFRGLGSDFGIDISSESAVAAGVVMGIMIIPFVSSLSDDVLTAVPQNMRDGSLAIGATTSETVTRVLLPAALPGIVGSILLAVSRAIGETMIVVMAAGLTANLTANPFQAVTTFTVQIVTLLIGDQEFDNPKTLAAFALGLLLFIITLCLNIVALYIVRRYREQYE